MDASLWIAGESYRLRSVRGLGPETPGRVSVAEATVLLRHAVEDPCLRARLTSLLGELPGNSVEHNACRFGLVDRLHAALASRRIELVAPPRLPPADVGRPRTEVMVDLRDLAEVSRATGVDDREHEIAVRLVDPWGRPVDVRHAIELPDGDELSDLHASAGVVRVDARGPGTCTVGFPGLADATALEEEPPEDELAPVPSARKLTRRDHALRWSAEVRQPAHVFQLQRRRATVVEIEHFVADGAIVLPAESPLPLRPGVPRVAGLTALKVALTHARGREHVIVAGHGPLAAERARNVERLLVGDRAGWADLCVGTARPEEKQAIAAWSPEPLPPATEEWPLTTWTHVFDLYARELGLAVPPPPRHVLRVLAPSAMPEGIWPVKIAEIVWGPPQAARAQELEVHNPHICHGPWQWKNPLVPGDDIVLPADWPIERLLARRFTVDPLDEDRPAPAELGFLEREPRLSACALRHLEHPYATARWRRGQSRHVEVLLLPDDAPTCADTGPCDTVHCEVYDPIAYELAYVQIGEFELARLVVNVFATHDEAALADVDVLVCDRGGHAWRRGITDSSGQATFVGLDPERVRVTAQLADRFGDACELPLELGDNWATLWLARAPWTKWLVDAEPEPVPGEDNLPRKERYVVRVHDAGGTGIAGVDVDLGGTGAARATTDAHGLATFTALPFGSYAIAARKGGFIAHRMPGLAIAETGSDVGNTEGGADHTIALAVAADLRVRVTHVVCEPYGPDDAAPIGGVLLEPEDQREQSRRTLANGEIVLDGLRAGTTVIAARKDGFSPVDQPVTLATTGNSPLVIRMASSATDAELRDRIVQRARDEALRWERAPGGNRGAWTFLNEYFRSVFPASQRVRSIRYPMSPNRNEIPHWCGIVAVHLVREAARPCLYWQLWDGMTGGPMEHGKPLQQRHDLANVQPGDILRFVDPPEKNPNHHGILLERRGNTIVTMEGNSVTYPESDTLELRTIKSKTLYDIEYYHRTVGH